jgi:hypothetical protein
MSIFFGSLVKTFNEVSTMDVYARRVYGIGIHMLLIGALMFIIGLISGFIW